MAKTYSRKQLDGFTIPQLRKIADLHFDPADTKGLKKAQLIELLDKHYNPPADVEDELDDEVDDLEDTDDELDDDEVDDTPKSTKPAPSTPPEPNGDTLTAKQVATRIGTDAKTLRKFFRAGVSDFKAVGQGGRYEFAKTDLPAIKAAFEKWNAGKTTRAKRTDSDKPKPTGRMASAVELDEDDEIDDVEPTSDELEDIDDLELDEDDDLELDDEED